MNILGYIGFAVLIFLATTWTIGVRVKLEASVFTILGALFFVSSAVFVGVSGVNKLHSWWIVPAGFIFMLFLARVSAILKFRVPIIFHSIRLIASVFANIIRIGVPEEKIKAAQEADAKATLGRFMSQ